MMQNPLFFTEIREVPFIAAAVSVLFEKSRLPVISGFPLAGAFAFSKFLLPGPPEHVPVIRNRTVAVLFLVADRFGSAWESGARRESLGPDPLPQGSCRRGGVFRKTGGKF